MVHLQTFVAYRRSGVTVFSHCCVTACQVAQLVYQLLHFNKINVSMFYGLAL